MQSIIKQAKDVLKQDFDITLDTDSLETYSPEEWIDFAEKRGIKDANGLFFPGSMSAYVNLNETGVYNLLHEHIGHRTYFEKAFKGLELRKLEDDVSSLERMIIGDNYNDILAGSLSLVRP